MNKPNLYWHIQHLDQIGGTEMVSIDLMNHLVDKYNITCLVTAEIINKPCYELNPNIKVISLNVPQQVTRIDAYCLKNKNNKKGYKNIGLVFKAFYHFFIRKYHYRKVIKSLIGKNPGKLISSATDSYLFAPKGVYSIFHFHFNTRNYFSFGVQFLLKCSRKPNEIVFLTKSTLEAVKAKKHLKSKLSYIYNPIRFMPVKNFENHNNVITFLGRFSNQKNPLFALEIAKVLKKENLSFHLNMYGGGPLQTLMEDYIKTNHLEKIVSIYEVSHDVKKILLASDLLLLTSIYEGFVLVKGEANAYSVPCISTYFGDSTVEMFTQGKDGYYFDSHNPNIFADKIKELLTNPNKLKALKKSSYTTSFKLTHDNIIPLWLDLLK